MHEAYRLKSRSTVFPNFNKHWATLTLGPYHEVHESSQPTKPYLVSCDTALNSIDSDLINAKSTSHFLKFWVLKGSASLTGEEKWAIKLSRLRLLERPLERVHLLIGTVACRRRDSTIHASGGKQRHYPSFLQYLSTKRSTNFTSQEDIVSN